jgi:hypothetical protein
LPYPEQKKDYVVPARYLQPDAEAKRGSVSAPSLGVTPTNTQASGDSEIITSAIELDESGRPREERVTLPKDIILVSWEGEDDPENPLNWLVLLIP